MLHILTEKININDYPVYSYYIVGSGAATNTSGSMPTATHTTTVDDSKLLDRPGLYLAEHHALRGIRYSVGLGYLAALVYFYGYHRPRLPFADRPLAKLHHWFYPSAGYTTPVGLVAGLAHGASAESTRLSEEEINATMKADTAAAKAAHSQYMQRKAAAEARLIAAEAWYVPMAARLRILKDTRAERLARANFTPEKNDWTYFIKRFSVLWVARHTQRVRDTRWYRGELPSDCVADVLPPPPPPPPTNAATAGAGFVPGNGTFSHAGNAVGCSGQAKLSSSPLPAATASPLQSPLPQSPPTQPHFTKRQIDGLVSRVLLLQNDEEGVRWTRTGGRFSLYGMTAMLVAWNSGNALFRLSMGLGAGVVAGSVVSAMRLDAIWTHL